MMKRTFVITGITIAAAILFVSFHFEDFVLIPAPKTSVNQSHQSTVKVIPENLAGVYKGIKPNYIINSSASANLSPDRKNAPGKKEVNFILIETGVIWLEESDLKDSVIHHYEGSYFVTANSQSAIEIKAEFRTWNKQGLNYFLRFDRNLGKAHARAEGEPEFELIQY